ncbi:PREDICTED: transmembrane protease serine 9-like [Phaethon lepturus]|uniref:transmembrane protease serine 9-like n=1 Tax=Phaethon lepturus TaxID=97097 RepID=UPI00053087A2|nr:PREDICTED: transmembrane protease serine 9-like [Phaethon lepturus]
MKVLFVMLLARVATGSPMPTLDDPCPAQDPHVHLAGPMSTRGILMSILDAPPPAGPPLSEVAPVHPMDLLVSPKVDWPLPPLINLLVQDSGDTGMGPPGVAMSHQRVPAYLCPCASRNVLWVIEGTSCDLPWQAALFKGEKFICGGTLVDRNWVVTAAHCHVPGPHIHRPPTNPDVFGFISFISVRLGGPSHKDSGGTEQWRRSAKVFKYPRYNETNKDGDLMLIKFFLPIHVNKQVKPLPLASHCPVPGKTCQISGWGSTTSPEGMKPVT